MTQGLLERQLADARLANATLRHALARTIAERDEERDRAETSRASGQRWFKRCMIARFEREQARAEAAKLVNESPSQRCRRLSVQDCHICEDMNCGDNLSAAANRIRELESAIRSSLAVHPVVSLDRMMTAYRRAWDEREAVLRDCLEPGSARKRIGEIGELRARLRRTAQILIEEVGADGPCDAEEAAERAVERIRHLSECMKTAGLGAFMRGHDPKEIAEHLSNVAKSWGRVEQFAKDAARWRESAWEYDDDMGHERRDFHDEEDWEHLEEAARRCFRPEGLGEKPEATYDCRGAAVVENGDQWRGLELADPENATIDEVAEALNKACSDHSFFVDRSGDIAVIGARLVEAGPASIEVIADPNMPPDRVDLRHPVTGETLGSIVNVGDKLAAESAIGRGGRGDTPGCHGEDDQ